MKIVKKTIFSDSKTLTVNQKEYGKDMIFTVKKGVSRYK